MLHKHLLSQSSSRSRSRSRSSRKGSNRSSSRAQQGVRLFSPVDIEIGVAQCAAHNRVGFLHVGLLRKRNCNGCLENFRRKQFKSFNHIPNPLIENFPVHNKRLISDAISPVAAKSLSAVHDLWPEWPVGCELERTVHLQHQHDS